jgi:gliding motility-associated-like protein
VNDTENPVIAGCPSNITLSNDPGSCDAVVTWIAPAATDNCNIASFTSNFNPGDVFPLGTSTVSYTAVDDAGNTVTCSFDVTVNDTENPVITNMPSDTIYGCIDTPVNWSEINATDNCPDVDINVTHQSGDIFELGATEVIVTATDNSGNSAQESFIVFIGENPEIAIIEEEEIYCSGKEIYLYSSSSTSPLQYEWIFGEEVIGTDISLTINNINETQTGVYTLIAYDSIGCWSVDTLFIEVEVCEIVVSEIMTPNGDGMNDNFIIENISAFPNTKLIIFNRWGSEVYRNQDYKNEWGGISLNSLNVGGNELPEGTYYYIIELGGDPNDEKFGKIYNGYVYLKR